MWTIPEGHITSSAIILSPDGGNVLMVAHKKLGIWVVPGGHYDIKDGKITKTPVREAQEEVGLDGLQLHPWHAAHDDVPIDIDTHVIPANTTKNEGEHPHFDFRYVVIASPDQPIEIQEAEVDEFRWVPVGEITDDMSVYPAIQKLGLIA